MSETDRAEIRILKPIELIMNNAIQAAAGMNDPALPGHIAFVLCPEPSAFLLNHVEYDISCTIAQGDIGRKEIIFFAAYPLVVKTVDFLAGFFRKMEWDVQLRT